MENVSVDSNRYVWDDLEPYKKTIYVLCGNTPAEGNAAAGCIGTWHKRMVREGFGDERIYRTEGK